MLLLPRVDAHGATGRQVGSLAERATAAAPPGRHPSPRRFGGKGGAGDDYLMPGLEEARSPAKAASRGGLSSPCRERGGVFAVLVVCVRLREITAWGRKPRGTEATTTLRHITRFGSGQSNKRILGPCMSSFQSP